MFPCTVDYLEVILLKSQNPSFYSGGVEFALKVDLWLENVFKWVMVGFDGFSSCFICQKL